MNLIDFGVFWCILLKIGEIWGFSGIFLNFGVFGISWFSGVFWFMCFLWISDLWIFWFPGFVKKVVFGVGIRRQIVKFECFVRGFGILCLWFWGAAWVGVCVWFGCSILGFVSLRSGCWNLDLRLVLLVCGVCYYEICFAFCGFM